MSIVDFLHELRRRQVHVSRDGERLHCRAPKGVLDAALRAAIAQRKDALLRMLAADAPEAEPVARDEHSPLSFAQQRLWFLHQLDPGGTHYNMPFAYRLCGALQVDALEHALGRVVARHESLRTLFEDDGGTPRQRLAEQTFALRHVDLRADAQRLEAMLLEDARRAFDLRRELPLRATLFRTAGDEWVLMLVVHHIAADGWSLGLIYRELAALYEAARTGVDPQLPPPRARYGDFALWQRRHLQGARLERLLRYWKRLERVPRLEIPVDEPERVAGTLAGSYVARTLNAELRAGVQALCAGERVTLFMLLFAAYAIVLSRHCGQRTFPLGAILANRNRTEFEDVVGFFVNMLPIPVDIDPALTFRAFLGRVREVVLESLEHQDLPFERILEAVHAERTASATGIPLLTALLSVQNAGLRPLHLDGVDAQWLPIDSGMVRFDLSLTAWDAPEQLRLQLHYRHDVLARDTAERLLSRIVTLLGAATANPDTPLPELPSFDAREERLLLREWNATAVEYPGEACIHERFAEWAKREPQRLAVECEGELWTYGQLAARVRTIARLLRAQGVGPETPVGICLERSPAMVAGILAVLTAGGAYVPLDPRYPRERLRMIIEDVGTPVILCDAATASVLPESAAARLMLDGLEDIADDGEPFPRPSLDHACVIYYTSGTTGRPKGAVLEHRSVGNYLHWISSLLRRAGAVNVPVVSSLNSDATLKQIFEPLLRGHSIWMLSRETVLQSSRLLASLSMRRDVAFNCVPTLWKAILETIEGGFATALPDLRALLIGGEELTTDLLRRTARHFPALAVFNLYGPTETTANSSSDCIEPGGAATIGRPIANTTIHLLDPQGRLVPAGAVGEICIGGAGVARGYHARPDLTAEKFIPDPWNRGGRLYRTGDLGRRRPDGRIEFRGRIDHQVQIRGFRVEPREVASVLETHPLVMDAVATMRGGDGARQRWIAYATVRRDVLHAGCERDVPDAWTPIRAFSSVESLLRALERDLPRDGAFVFRSLRSLPLLHAFHFWRRLADAADDVRAGELLRAARRDAAEETELLLAPSFFHRLGDRHSSLRSVEIEPAGTFGYDVVLRFGKRACDPLPDLAWSDDIDLHDVLERAAQHPLRLCLIPNARVEPLIATMDAGGEEPELSAAELRRRIAATRVIDADALVTLASSFGCSAWLSVAPDGTRGELDCVLAPRNCDPRGWAGVRALPPLPWSAYANEPLLPLARKTYGPLLRDHIAARLPDYMVPSAVVLLDAFPLTPNGKIDFESLPDADATPMTAHAEPRTPREAALCGIWKDILGLDRVGIDDNFFQIGGDSIVSLQMIARAARAGLHITPKDIFSAQTIARLAIVARDAAAPLPDAPRACPSQFPLTAIQQRFFDLELAEPQHFNQAVLLECDPEWSASLVRDAVARVVAHHDAFRLRFTRETSGEWRQRLVDELPALEVIDLSSEDSSPVSDVIARAHRSLDYMRGPIARFLYLDLGPSRRARFFIVMHHLICDGVSWRVLLEDLRSGQLPARTSSYGAWADAVARYAHSDALAAEAEHWLAVADVRGVELPRETSAGSNLEGRSAVVELNVDAHTTAVLLGRSRALDLLLAALARAVERVAGSGPLKVTLEGHGRECPAAMDGALDVSRTVGWFTAVFPAVLDIRGTQDAEDCVRRVSEQLRAIPNGGIGYGILHYLRNDPALRARLASAPQPEINFNYLGRFQPHDGILGFRPAAESAEPLRSPAGQRRHLIDVDVLAFDGRLRMSWRYPVEIFTRAFIESLTAHYANALRELTAQRANPISIATQEAVVHD